MRELAAELEIRYDRYDRRSKLITSQIPVEQWHAYLQDPTIADAILDRLIHNSYRLALKGESMRKQKGRRRRRRNPVPVDERQRLNESINVVTPSARHGVERQPGMRWNQRPTSVECARARPFHFRISDHEGPVPGKSAAHDSFILGCGRLGARRSTRRFAGNREWT